jgi:hypothetical protein
VIADSLIRQSLPASTELSEMDDVRATAILDGELVDEFERRLDVLLAELSPGWQVPELQEPYSNDARFWAYFRRDRKRSQVGDALMEWPETAVRLADAVLDVIACDEDVASNRQLIGPMLAAVGRRRVQKHLISVVETGGLLQKVCAVRAWYWSQVTLVYRSAEDLRDGAATPQSVAADYDVADLQAWYREACLAAFVSSDHVSTRGWLARGFILDESFYLPGLHDLVLQPRMIASADPIRYADLLAKTTDGTNMAAIEFDWKDEPPS